MKGKREKERMATDNDLSNEPFESLLPEAQMNTGSLAGLLTRFSGVRLPGRPVARMHTTL